jgi:hypothetical protein
MIANFALALLMATQQTDTTVSVGANASVNVNDFAGSIAVKTWDKNSVRVVAHHSRRDRVIVSSDDGTVRVRTSGTVGPSFTVDIELTVPATAALKLEGTYTDITVDGARGKVDAKTVQGDVKVNGGAEWVNLYSVEGVVVLANAKGKVTVKAVNKSAKLTNISGTVYVEGINGGVTLDKIDSDDVDVTTVNGAIIYDGAIKDKGQYRFGSHNGRVSVAIPDGANASVSTVTYSGSFKADMVTTASVETGANKRRRSFRLGTGSATIEIESFQGSIRLRKAGTPDKGDPDDENDEDDEDHSTGAGR